MKDIFALKLKFAVLYSQDNSAVFSVCKYTVGKVSNFCQSDHTFLGVFF